ncbi:MAG: phage integrase SAM-like domain-containing protein [Bacteroidota bacterium]
MSTYEFHNQQLAERVGKDCARTTYVRFTTGLKHIREFLQYHYKRDDIPLRKLDHAFISSFDHYLRTVRNINNNSTVKYVSLFRKTIRMAIKNGWLDKDPFANHEGRLRVVDGEYLSKEKI